MRNLAENIIKDTDYLYASARIKALEKNLLTRDRMERMCEARSMEDAFKVLTECGWPEITSTDMSAVEAALAHRRSETFALIQSVAPDKRIPAVFLMKYDYHNLKTLLKSEVTGEKPEPLLIDAGRVSVKQLLAMVRENNFSDMPPAMAKIVVEGRDLLSRTRDPQLLDFYLDRAQFAEMLETAEAFGSAFLTGYIKLMIDSVNLRAAVRLRRMGKGSETLRFALLPGGNVSIMNLQHDITPDLIDSVFANSPLSAAASAGAAVLRGEGSLAAMDLASDDALLHYLKRAKYVAFGAETLIGYLAAQESELTAVRIIIAGRLAGLSAEMIIERLRDAYV
ncbi:MAG TPA: V-type ATP synthase subunit C [Peptococcaceae bacterium]|nr:V-type ATP synthase subunit C [Peptococcaceae bacterium]